MELVALLLLRVATFSDLRKRRNGTHGLKAAEENQPQKPCSSSIRDNMPVHHVETANLIPCVLLILVRSSRIHRCSF